MGCSQSTGAKLTMEQRFSPEILALLTGGTGESPPPTIDLTTKRAATKIDGVLWAELLRAGFSWLVQNKDECNRINVFPVPDGDTGTNMCLAVQGGVKSYVDDGPDASITTVAERFQGRVLLAAQGNSGTILSFFFMTLYKLLKSDRKAELTLAEFQAVVGNIGSQMMSCMPDAQVGTMISVVKESSNDLAAHQASSLEDMVNAWVKAGQASLARTPDQLVVDGKHILRNAGVVDSGAKGFVLLLEGMQMALAGTLEYGEYLSAAKDPEAMDQAVEGGQDLHEGHDHGSGELKYRFCTECVVQMKSGATSAELNAAVQGLGDSIVPVVSQISEHSCLGKLHIHSNEPGKVFECVRHLSTTVGDNGLPILLKEKCDDMADQVQITGHVKSSYTPPNMSSSQVCIVWESSADVPEAFRDKHERWCIPLKLTIDDVAYDDRVEMAPTTMYNTQRIKAYKSMSTGGASPATFTTTLARACDTSGRPEVLIIMLPRPLSKGSWAGLEGGMKELTPAQRKMVNVFECDHTTTHEGVLVMRAYELAAKGHSAQEIMADLKIYQNDYACLEMTIRDISYGRLTGRLDSKLMPTFALNHIENKKKGICMGYQFQKYKKDATPKPDIITITPSGEKITKKIAGYFNKCATKILNAKTASYAPEITQFDVTIAHTARPDSTRDLESLLRQDPVIGPRLRHVHLASMGGVLGVHFGPGGNAASLAPVVNELLASGEVVETSSVEVELRTSAGDSSSS